MLGWFKKKKDPYITAIVVGDDNELPSHYRMPILLETTGILGECPEISDMVILCGSHEVAGFYIDVLDFRIPKVAKIIAGKGNWSGSAALGVEACNSGTEYYLFHDGMRPFLTREILEDCIGTALLHGAAQATLKMDGDIRMCDCGYLTNYRQKIPFVEIQTPWMIKKEHYHAGNWKIQCSKGSRENQKINVIRDLAYLQSHFLTEDEIMSELMPY